VKPVHGGAPGRAAFGTLSRPRFGLVSSQKLSKQDDGSLHIYKLSK
jgi:hypothetical protein